MNEQNSLIYNDPKSLLVVNPKGKIKRIYTPFVVISKAKIDNINIGDEVEVDEVFEEADLNKHSPRIIIFSINGRKYRHNYFEINAER